MTEEKGEEKRKKVQSVFYVLDIAEDDVVEYFSVMGKKIPRSVCEFADEKARKTGHIHIVARAEMVFDGKSD